MFGGTDLMNTSFSNKKIFLNDSFNKSASKLKSEDVETIQRRQESQSHVFYPDKSDKIEASPMKPQRLEEMFNEADRISGIHDIQNFQ